MKLAAATAGNVAELVLGTCDALGYWRPKTGVDFDLFVAGVRNASDQVGPFDDAQLALTWTGRDAGTWNAWVWRATTDAGREGVIAGGNRGGIGRLVDGQFRACWEAGIHHSGKPGAHRALVQTPVATFRCWRDVDVDGLLPRSGREHTDARGVNCHRPYRDGLLAVGDASWMCQVPHARLDHDVLMRLYDEQVSRHPGWNRVSYTLFDAAKQPELGRVLQLAGVTP